MISNVLGSIIGYSTNLDIDSPPFFYRFTDSLWTGFSQLGITSAKTGYFTWDINPTVIKNTKCKIDTKNDDTDELIEFQYSDDNKSSWNTIWGYYNNVPSGIITREDTINALVTNFRIKLYSTLGWVYINIYEMQAIHTRADMMVDDSSELYTEDSWQVRMFGLRTNPLKGKLFKY